MDRSFQVVLKRYSLPSLRSMLTIKLWLFLLIRDLMALYNASDTIQGLAGAASQITIHIFGIEMN
jgi:hypothetical protein